MSAPFESKWLAWTPDRPPLVFQTHPTLPPSKPTKPSSVSFGPPPPYLVSKTRGEAGDRPLDSEIPPTPPPSKPSEPTPETSPSYPCLDCKTELEEGVLLCSACLERRRGPGRLLRFDLDHRPQVAAPRPPGTPHHLSLGGGHTTDAIRNGEPCPICRCTDWRLVAEGLWLDDGGHYWSPSRPASHPEDYKTSAERLLVEKPISGPAQAPAFETGRPA
jgi:hypothetical protein